MKSIPLPDGAILVYGSHLDGAGPARFGWGIRYVSGRVRYLARTAIDAEHELRQKL